MGRLEVLVGEVRGAPLFGASVSTEMLGYLCRQKALNFNIFVNQGPESRVEGSGLAMTHYAQGYPTPVV